MSEDAQALLDARRRGTYREWRMWEDTRLEAIRRGLAQANIDRITFFTNAAWIAYRDVLIQWATNA